MIGKSPEVAQDPEVWKRQQFEITKQRRRVLGPQKQEVRRRTTQVGGQRANMEVERLEG